MEHGKKQKTLAHARIPGWTMMAAVNFLLLWSVGMPPALVVAQTGKERDPNAVMTAAVEVRGNTLVLAGGAFVPHSPAPFQGEIVLAENVIIKGKDVLPGSSLSRYLPAVLEINKYTIEDQGKRIIARQITVGMRLDGDYEGILR